MTFQTEFGFLRENAVLVRPSLMRLASEPPVKVVWFGWYVSSNPPQEHKAANFTGPIAGSKVSESYGVVVQLVALLGQWIAHDFP
jgi:hypothetical protein